VDDMQLSRMLLDLLLNLKLSEENKFAFMWLAQGPYEYDACFCAEPILGHTARVIVKDKDRIQNCCDKDESVSLLCLLSPPCLTDVH
jgi:hypothetical protein